MASLRTNISVIRDYHSSHKKYLIVLFFLFNLAASAIVSTVEHILAYHWGRLFFAVVMAVMSLVLIGFLVKKKLMAFDPDGVPVVAAVAIIWSLIMAIHITAMRMTGSSIVLGATLNAVLGLVGCLVIAAIAPRRLAQ